MGSSWSLWILSNLAEETRLEMAALLKRCTSSALHSNPRPRSALLLLRPLSVGRFASLRFRLKNMAHHIFQLESKLQNIPEAAPEEKRISPIDRLELGSRAHYRVRRILLEMDEIGARCMTDRLRRIRAEFVSGIE